VATLAVVFGEDVEEEGLYIVIQSFVVQEQLGEKAKVLAVDLVGISIHLEDRDVATSVDLSGRRVAPQALV
jgi:hypothetical protein